MEKRTLPTVMEMILAAIVVLALLLLLRTFFEVGNLRKEMELQAVTTQSQLDVINGNRFTSTDFVKFLTLNTDLADSLRVMLDIPPPEVRDALESLQAGQDSLEALHREQ